VLKRFYILIGLLAAPSLLHGQAAPTASRFGDLQLGVGYGIADSDYSPEKFKGIAAYADFDFTPHLGAEVEFRQLNDPAPAGLYEKTYEGGVRYHRSYGRLSPYAKGMYGRGVFNYQYGAANIAYNMFAIGAGADYRVLSYLNVRFDFEYQSWSGFPPHGLSPTVGTFGVAYHFASPSFMSK
jgi:Outer membrane protein beta-barrel domain